MLENEYIQTVLMMLGIPEMAFSYADPMAILVLFIFSTRMLVLVLAIVLWAGLYFLKMYRSGGIEVQQNNHDAESMIRRYDKSSMKKVYKVDKKPSMLSVFFKGFVFPVFIIFIALSIAVSVYNG